MLRPLSLEALRYVYAPPANPRQAARQRRALMRAMRPERNEADHARHIALRTFALILIVWATIAGVLVSRYHTQQHTPLRAVIYSEPLADLPGMDHRIL